ncbi:hypothetical protein M407DRAFT_19977 [Tulasnella calospora MUT 4182]|uniref:RING-type domain-containing protein n=1 Tax=Tulasnella calospora MUT 4182 TaxID=1051891 RepID=A0A0C3QH38_9AGAM|nr:hypothetical protein M407DRAFT_19977 [Tulasnella calospora MUT 4182]
MIECQICQNVFNSDTVQAHCFGCGHLCCLKCIKKLRKPGCPLNCPLPSSVVVPTGNSDIRRLNVSLVRRVYVDFTDIAIVRDLLAETEAELEEKEEELEEKEAQLEEREAELEDKEEELEDKDEIIRELKEQLEEKEAELEEKDRLIRQLEEQMRQLSIQREPTSKQKSPAGQKKKKRPSSSRKTEVAERVDSSSSEEYEPEDHRSWAPSSKGRDRDSSSAVRPRRFRTAR